MPPENPKNSLLSTGGAADALGLGDSLTEQVMALTEEQKRKKLLGMAGGNQGGITNDIVNASMSLLGMPGTKVG